MPVMAVSPAKTAKSIEMLFEECRLVWAQGNMCYMDVYIYWRHLTNTVEQSQRLQIKGKSILGIAHIIVCTHYRIFAKTK